MSYNFSTKLFAYAIIYILIISFINISDREQVGQAVRGHIVGLKKTPESFKKLNENQWQEWHKNIYTLFWKIWGIIFLVQLLLLLFYKPTADYSRLQYFCHFILTPSGLECIILLLLHLVFTKIIVSRKRRAASIYTILLISSFAAVTVFIHTSVTSLPTMLILPMMLTPLYKDKFMTLLQAVIVIIIFALSHFYFIPHNTIILPDTSFSPLVELCIFIGGTMATIFILERVNATLLLNEERSVRDSLTHLYNHESFYKELEYYRNQFDQNHTRFSVIIADIDNFKKVNDTYGHAFGDEVIRRLGNLFLQIGKKEAFSARYGGEEFTMILPHANPVPIAEQIRTGFEAIPFETKDGIRHFTLSLGAAVYDRKYENGSHFFEKADAALYEAKDAGKNRVVLYQENNL